MQSSEDRDILYFDSKLMTSSRSFENLPPKNIQFYFECLKELYEKGQAYHEYKKKTEALYLADIQSNDMVIKLLINRSDQKAADVILSDYMKNTRRLVEKDEGEGNDYSAHVLISINEIEGQPKTHLFLLEYAPGLGKSRIEHFLNALLRKCKEDNPEKFTMKNPDGSFDKDGNPNFIKITSKIELSGHVSDEFKEELEHGTIRSLRLYTPIKNNPFDEYSYTSEKTKIIDLKLTESGRMAKKFEMLKKVCKQAKSKDMDKLRIKFTNDENTQRTVHLQTDTVVLASDFMFVKKKKITDFSTKMHSSYNSLNEEIIEKMNELM